MEPVPCARCGVFIRERSELLYTDDGEPMCAPCRKKADEPRKLRAVTDPILWRALGGAFWGVIGLPISVVFLAGPLFGSVPALTTGLIVLSHLRGDEALRERLGGRYRLVWLSAWVAVAFGALGCLTVVANVLLRVWS